MDGRKWGAPVVRIGFPAGAMRVVIGFAVLLAACGKDSTGPGQRDARLAIFAGDAQFAAPGQSLAEPLLVLATDVTSGAVVDNVRVEWRVVEGAGASVVPISIRTDETGVAGANVNPGQATGTVRVEARSGSRTDQRVEFTITVIDPPHIDGVIPQQVVAGEQVVLAGTGFSPDASLNAVRFGAFRGTVESASTTQLVVRAPRCLPGRPVTLSVSIGAVSSNLISVETVATPGTLLDLAPGQAFVSESAADLDCIRLPFVQGAEYLFVTQNAASAFSPELALELRGVASGGPITAPPAPAIAASHQLDWEWQLRARERELQGAYVPPPPVDRALATTAVPQVGDRREFRVLTSGNKSTRIQAEVKHVSSHAVIYQDVEAPAAGLLPADFAQLGALFDDPIHPAVTLAFGEPSDIDANERIIILFTPRVNQLTPKGQNSFIVGYFYGCDLVPASRCPDTNRAEVFYSYVPDPQGQFGDVRSRDLVLQTVPAVLAHELQHMISFVARNQSLDALWLSEALAHAAEDVVADVFASRGDAAREEDFRYQNHNRARHYLLSVAETSIITDAGTGSLELRGGSWLFVKYLMQHYGGNLLLRQLTANTATGVANVTSATGQPWTRLLADFSIALWADNAPELAGANVDPRLTFPEFDIREATSQGASGFPLKPAPRAAGDFAVDYRLPPASQAYTILRHSTGPVPPPLYVTLTRAHGAAFSPTERPALGILRIR